MTFPNEVKKNLHDIHWGKKTFLWKKQLLQRQGIQLLSKVLHHRQRQGTVIAAELTFQSHKIDPQVVGVEKPEVQGECDSKWLTENDMQLYMQLMIHMIFWAGVPDEQHGVLFFVNKPSLENYHNLS